MKIGYARVSTTEQSVILQTDSLTDAGCEKIFSDLGVSGTVFERPGLDRALSELRPGDTLVVWRLDRLGRSLTKLVELINELGDKRTDFMSITEAIDTRTSGGTLVFHLMAALAEFERNLISERTRAGLAAARAGGKQLGRRPALSPEQRELAIELIKTQTLSDVAAQLAVHPQTLKRTLRAK